MKTVKELEKLAGDGDRQKMLEIAYLEGRRESLLQGAKDKALPSAARESLKKSVQAVDREFREKVRQETTRLMDERIEAGAVKAGAKPTKLVARLVKKSLTVALTAGGEVDITLDGLPFVDPSDIDRFISRMKHDPETKILFTEGEQTGGDSRSTKRHSGGNPWKKGSVNLTRQGEIIASDKGLARRLIVEAGLPPASYGL